MRFNRNSQRRLFDIENGVENGGNGGGGDGGDAGGQGGDEGKAPSAREAELLKEVMKKKDALNAAKQRTQELEGKLKEFDGIDVVEVRKLLDDRKAAETKKLEEKGEFDRIRQQMVQEHETNLSTLKTTSEAKIAELTEALAKRDSAINELTIGRSFGDSGFVRDSLTLTPGKARVVYGSHFELKDGKVVAYDKPAGAAERTMLVDGKGNPLSFEDAMLKIVEADPDKDQLLKSKLKTGAASKSDGKAAAPEKVIGEGRDRIGAAIAAGGLKLPGSTK